jgi:hypothetical protein
MSRESQYTEWKDSVRAQNSSAVSVTIACSLFNFFIISKLKFHQRAH